MDQASAPECFVYYRVARADAAAVEACVRAFQGRLCAEWAGLEARMLVRADDRGGEELTFMETYRCGDGSLDIARFASDLERASLALQPWLRGQRHLESFLPLV